MRRTLAALAVRAADLAARGGAGAAGQLAPSIASRAPATALPPPPSSLTRGFAASTSGRAIVVVMQPFMARGVATTSAAAAAAEDAAASTTSTSGSAHAIAALKARLMPATGRNQFRRKWKKQAEIKANHRRRLHQEALASARKLRERKARWAAAASAGRAGEGMGVEAPVAGGV